MATVADSDGNWRQLCFATNCDASFNGAYILDKCHLPLDCKIHWKMCLYLSTAVIASARNHWTSQVRRLFLQVDSTSRHSPVIMSTLGVHFQTETPIEKESCHFWCASPFDYAHFLLAHSLVCCTCALVIGQHYTGHSVSLFCENLI